jgi:uncharacterized protein
MPGGPVSHNAPSDRFEVRFPCDGATCAGWHYPGVNGGCVIMAGGLAQAKEPATDLFARRFSDAGFGVLAFDYRRLGRSGGRPRQIVRIGEQLLDWHAAIAFARTLPAVDPARLAIWGFSLSGGHVFAVAARNPDVAAAIAQSPLVDARVAIPNAARHQTPSALLRLAGRGLLDAGTRVVGRGPVLVPLAGEPGTVAASTTPDALDADRALNPDNMYPDWQQEVAAGSALRLGLYRPGRHASRVRIPLLVVACDDDRTAPPGPAIRAARRAPFGELARLRGGHYAPFLRAHQQAADTQIAFLRRGLDGRSPARAARGGDSRRARGAHLHGCGRPGEVWRHVGASSAPGVVRQVLDAILSLW